MKLRERVSFLLGTNRLVKVLEIIFVFAIGVLCILLFKSDNENDLVYNQIVIWSANILMLAAVYTGLRLRGESWAHFGLVFKKFDSKYAIKTFLQSLLVFLLALTGFVLGSIVMANITGIPEQTDLSLYSYLQDNIGMLFITLAGVYIGSSMGEEIIYRAFLIIRVTELGVFHKGNKWLGLIISALFFGLAHYSWGPIGIVQTAFMGLVLGLCYLYLNKRIWVLIFAHAYLDTILMVQLYLGSQ